MILSLYKKRKKARAINRLKSEIKTITYILETNSMPKNREGLIQWNWLLSRRVQCEHEIKQLEVKNENS